jgi:hypothetical protein
MIIDNTNYEIGNKAIASILLLYYHLLNEGGVTNAQALYTAPNGFSVYELLDVKVQEKNEA